MIEICAVGGYNEVGRNMTAVKIGEEVVVLDMGLHLENYIRYTEEEEDTIKVSATELSKVDAIPNISVIEKWRKQVKIIIPSHAHLDHVGAIPFISNKYNAQIMGTPFTIAVIKSILQSEKIKLKNSLKVLNVNSMFKLSPDITIEFINTTHSTPQTVMIAVHTKEGIILYANDFKFDRYPTIGKKPDFKRLEELGKLGVKTLIVDSTYAELSQKTPSEAVAKQMLTDVVLGTDSRGHAVIVTTFSSHLARLKNIIELGKRLNRKVVFLGRSLSRYAQAGEEVGIVDFSKEVEIVKYGKQIKRRLKKIMKEGKDKYLLVVTGHQGEPRATLSKMVDGVFDFKFDPDDEVIFSCKVIPTATNRASREQLDKKLRSFGVRIFSDIHTSGHAAREDLRDLINLVKPKHIIPAHGELKMTSALADLAVEMGYEPGEQVHLLRNGQFIKLN
ncbi:MAG: RNase J family beta-CASP ribonuclease [bacterium]|nr:RNase J family beta-CASP ribonuclease [bacterium]